MSMIKRLLGREEEEPVKDDESGERLMPEPTWRATEPDAPTEQTDLPWRGSPDYRKATEIVRGAYDSEAAAEVPTPTREGASRPGTLADAPSPVWPKGAAPLSYPGGETRSVPIQDSGVHLLPAPAPAIADETCPHCGGRMPTDHELLTEVLNVLAPAGGEAVHRFYERLFEVRPDLRELFPARIEEQEEKLLSAIVALLKLFQAGDDEMEQLDSALARFGRSHTRFEPAATIEEYAAVWTVLGEVLVSMVGDKMTERHWKVLRRAYEYAAGKMLAAQATAKFTGTGRRRRTA